MTDNKVVSVITPVINAATYLEKCILSVLDQDYSPIEHIFVDGGSVDGTLDVLTGYAMQYPGRVRFISATDRNTEDAWNKGLRMAKGEILGWLGADDMYELGAVSTVADFFTRNPDAYFVFGGSYFIDENDEIIRRHVARDFDLKEAINDSANIPTSSAFYRKKLVDAVGFIDEKTRASDLDYWIRAGKIFRIHRIENILSRFRKHRHSSSGSYWGTIRYAWESIKVSRRYGGNIFSSYRRYLRLLVIEPLAPVAGPVYPAIKKMLKIE